MGDAVPLIPPHYTPVTPTACVLRLGDHIRAIKTYSLKFLIKSKNGHKICEITPKNRDTTQSKEMVLAIFLTFSGSPRHKMDIFWFKKNVKLG